MADELVLVVDDRCAPRRFIVDRVLVPRGYRTLEEERAEGAVQRARDAHPDLLILGLGCCGFSDIQVLESLRERGHILPVLIYAPQDRAEAVLRALHLGVRACVCEPLVEEEVLAAVEQALEEPRLRRERDRLGQRLQRQVLEQKTFYAIGQTMISEPDRQQVLNRLVEAAVFVTNADDGGIFLQDPDVGMVYIRSRLSAGQQHARALNRAVQDPMVQLALESGSPQVLPASGAATKGGTASALAYMPLCSSERPIGVLRVARLAHAHPFSQDDLDKLAILASYGTIALENIGLHAEIENEIERTTISQIGATFSSTLRLDLILDRVVEVAIHIVGAERGFLVLLGEGRQETAHRVIRGLAPETLDAPEFRFARRIVQRVVEEGEPILTIVERTRIEDGTGFEPRAAICVPITGASGPIGAIYGDHRDSETKFTETHRAMWTALAVHAAAAIENARLFHQVRAEQTKLEAVIRGIEQPVIVTDVDDRVVLMNAAAHRVFGTGRTRGTGMLLAELIGHPSLSTLLDQAQSSGQIGYGEIVVDRDRAFSVSVTPIPGIGLVTVMQDVTSIKELSEMKSEFVAAVSHDLRSPLSTVYSLLDAIEQVGPLNEQQQDFAANARQELTRLLDLTSGLLDLAGLEADIELEMTPCDLGGVVTRSADTWRDQVEERGLVLDVDVPQENLLVLGNLGRLWQVIDNLLSNAIKYTAAGGRVAVCVALEGQEAVLRVRDTGIGIAPEDQPYVFDRFFRGRNELAESVQGTGLGLAIVKSIVERHGGRVWLESAPGEGSMLGVALPRYDGES